MIHPKRKPPKPLKINRTQVAYRAGTIKRRRRSREQIEQLDNQILEVLAEDHPQSIRHVFYRMTNPRLPESVEKSDKGYRHTQHRMTQLRRGGRLSYGWISDATRRGFHVNTYQNAAEFLQSVSGLYRGDLWQYAEVYVEVWCESRSIAGVIQKDCRELAVSLYPAGGFSSITLAYQAADYINATVADRGIPAVVLYIGDYDPAGVLIDRSIESELRTHLNDDVELQFRRLAITEEQIAEYDLPTKPRKAGDRRAQHVAETVEAEAMAANDLRKILRDAINEYLPQGALDVIRVAERSERQILQMFAEKMRG
jgi:hypothetical protein